MSTDYERHRDIALGLLDSANELGGVNTIDHALAAAQVHAALALAAATWSPETTIDFAIAEPAEADSGSDKVYHQYLEPQIDGAWISMPMLGSATARVQVGTISGRHNEGVFLTAATPTENVEVQISFEGATKLIEQIQRLIRFHLPIEGGAE